MKREVKLGKKPQRIDSRTLKLKKYLPPGPPPAEVSWITRVPSVPMHYNDRLGCCTIAAAAHMIEAWTFYASGQFTPMADSAVLKAYEDVSGYRPANPNDPQTNSTDNGAVILDVLNYWRKTGIGGHQIMAYVQVDQMNDIELQWGLQLFGGLYTGAGLPLSAQTQVDWTVADGGIYTGEGAPWSWGGHAFRVGGSSPITRSIETWDEKIKCSHNWWRDYVDEVYAIISPEWLGSAGVAPSGFNLPQLQADLAQL